LLVFRISLIPLVTVWNAGHPARLSQFNKPLLSSCGKRARSAADAFRLRPVGKGIVDDSFLDRTLLRRSRVAGWGWPRRFRQRFAATVYRFCAGCRGVWQLGDSFAYNWVIR
jgi:hypothetical protein